MKGLNSWKTGLVTVLLLSAGCVSPYRLPATRGAAVAVSIEVDASEKTGVLDHSWEAMTGSGNASLYVRPGWSEKTLAQLSDAHDNLGIEMVRFHGIFLDKVGVYQGPGQYDFSNVDKIYDRVLAAGVKPFIELSFMPEQLASGKAVGFPLGYRPNISPPDDYEEWARMIEAFTRHLVDRYGLDEVKTWYFEVWNEPDLSVFWSGDMDDYFRLYDLTAKAVKSASPELKVGGPSTSQSKWILEFLNHCQAANAPVDFISTHGYYNDNLSGVLAQARKVIPEAEKDLTGGDFRDALNLINRIAAKIHPKKLPLFFTEWGSSSIYSYNLSRMTRVPQDHDFPNDAPFMCKAVKEANGRTAGFSHWTYSDVFEEWGLPGDHWPVKRAAFHGGFGIITIDGIHKPSYHAFKFLHQMGRSMVKTGVNSPRKNIDALSTLDRDSLAIMTWYWLDTIDRKEKSGPPAMITLKLENLPKSLSGKKLAAYRIDQDHGNAFSEWVKMGKPGNLTAEQIRKLKEISDGTLRAPELDAAINGSNFEIRFPLPPAAVVFFSTG